MSTRCFSNGLTLSQMSGTERWTKRALERFCDTVAMALARGMLIASEGHARGFNQPGANGLKGRALSWEPGALIVSEEGVVVGLGVQVLTLLGGYTELGQVFIPDTDIFAGFCEGAL